MYILAHAFLDEPHSFAAKRLIVPMQALPYMIKLTPAIVRRHLIRLVPSSDLHQARDLVDVMDENSQNILRGKREAIASGDAAVLEQIGKGKDLMSLLSRFFLHLHWIIF